MRVAWGDASPQTPANHRRVGIDDTAIPRQFTDPVSASAVQDKPICIKIPYGYAFGKTDAHPLYYYL